MYNTMNGIEIPVDTKREVIITQENSLQVSKDVVDSVMLVSTIIIVLFAILKVLDKFIDRKNKPLEKAISGNAESIKGNAESINILSKEFRTTHEKQNENLTNIHKELGEIKGIAKVAIAKFIGSE